MSRFKTFNRKVVSRGKFTTISPVLGNVTMSHLDLGGGKYTNGLLSEDIEPCEASITVVDTTDPATVVGGGTVLTLGEVVLVEGVHWEVAAGDVGTTASNIATAVDRLRGFSASAIGAEVAVTGDSGVVNLVFKQVDRTENLTLDPDTGIMTNGSPAIVEPEID